MGKYDLFLVRERSSQRQQTGFRYLGRERTISRPRSFSEKLQPEYTVFPTAWVTNASDFFGYFNTCTKFCFQLVSWMKQKREKTHWNNSYDLALIRTRKAQRSTHRMDIWCQPHRIQVVFNGTGNLSSRGDFSSLS